MAATRYGNGSNHAASGRRVACVGRLTAKWLGVSAACEPQLVWQDDGSPLFCEIDAPNATAANATAANATVANATVANATLTDATLTNATAVNTTAVNATADNAITVNATTVNATAANATAVTATASVSITAATTGSTTAENKAIYDPRPPLRVAARHPHVFRGFDGELYLCVGGGDAVHALTLNATNGRLPEGGQHVVQAAATLLAVGPAFEAPEPTPLDDLAGVSSLSLTSRPRGWSFCEVASRPLAHCCSSLHALAHSTHRTGHVVLCYTRTVTHRDPP